MFAIVTKSHNSQQRADIIIHTQQLATHEDANHAADVDMLTIALFIAYILRATLCLMPCLHTCCFTFHYFFFHSVTEAMLFFHVNHHALF